LMADIITSKDLEMIKDNIHMDIRDQMY
jgi:hypothetical protein